MSRLTYKTLCIALNGFHADCLDTSGNEVSCSGIYAQPYTLEGVLAKLVGEGQNVDGCWVIDKRPAIETHGTKVVFQSPLCKSTLQDGEVDSLGDLIQPGKSLVADAVASDPGNGFGNIIRGARAGLMNLDSVSPSAYATYWREKGAIVYQVDSKGVKV